MDIKPVVKMKKPAYPVKQEVSASELKKALPKRWTTSMAAMIAAGALAAATLAGCRAPYYLVPAGEPKPANTDTEHSVQWGQKPSPSPSIEFTQTAGVPAPSETPVIDDYVTGGIPMMPTIWAAPLFVHGEGRGVMGCVMVAPPVFLSEQEALVVINEAAKEYGLKFSDSDAFEIYDVQVPVTSLNPSDTDAAVGGIVLPSGVFGEITSDFTDPDSMVTIEYVSVLDVREWAADSPDTTVEEYHTKNAAEQLQKGFAYAYADDLEYQMGVLYDPCAQVGSEEEALEDPEKAQETAREASVSMLKAQAKDFFEWLKSEGII